MRQVVAVHVEVILDDEIARLLGELTNEARASIIEIQVSELELLIRRFAGDLRGKIDKLDIQNIVTKNEEGVHE